MDIHQLIEIGSPEAAEQAFTEAVVAQSGQPPNEKALREVHHWWMTAHILNELLQGSLMLRCINGENQITRIGDYK